MTAAVSRLAWPAAVRATRRTPSWRDKSTSPTRAAVLCRDPRAHDAAARRRSASSRWSRAAASRGTSAPRRPLSLGLVAGAVDAGQARRSDLGYRRGRRDLQLVQHVALLSKTQIPRQTVVGEAELLRMTERVEIRGRVVGDPQSRQMPAIFGAAEHERTIAGRGVDATLTAERHQASTSSRLSRGQPRTKGALTRTPGSDACAMLSREPSIRHCLLWALRMGAEPDS